MNAIMPDAARIGALAERLRIGPRALLVLLARRAMQADAHALLDDVRMRRELAVLREAPEAARDAAALALLGPGAYALDDIDNALGMIWADAAGAADR
ncbi:hypothetical protein [Dokdonella sp.]|uniref:hypothetical protein n=1 Tax=Dokdonella sp. TaxID=2291710 RepID=UPI002F416BC8